MHQGERRAEVPGRGDEHGRGDHTMMNGVDPPRMGALRDDPPMGAEPRTADHPDEGGLIHRAVETNEPAQGEPTRMMTASVPPLGADVRPGEESDFASLTASPPSPRRARGLQGSSSDQPHRAERTPAMEYSYEAAEGIPGVRWVARLTEFLRATTTRTSGLQGRVLEGLGLMGSQTANSATLPQRQQHQQPGFSQPTFSPIRRIGDLNFSPPEELPPPPPGSREVPRPLTQGPEPLFTPEQSDRLRRGPRTAPLLFPTGGSSTSSEEIQAEVQRQLARYVQRYEGEARDLRGQVEQLQLERNQLLAAQSVWQQNLPGGDPRTMPTRR